MIEVLEGLKELEVHMTKKKHPYHELIVWQRADEFVREVYKITINFPLEEKFGITSQLRRAAISVVLNIVEGQARGTKKDFVRFLLISRGSCSECAYLLEISLSLGYLNQEQYNELEDLRQQANYLLQRLIRSLR